MPVSHNKYLATAAALLAAAFTCGLSQPARADDDAAMKKLQGTWVVTSAVYDGMPLNSAKGAKFKFTGDKVEMSINGKNAPFHVKIDTSAKPHHIDFVLTEDAEEKMPPLLAVFQFAGEKLKLVISGNEVSESINDEGEKVRTVTAGKRPTALDSKQGMLTTLERVKE